MSSDGSPPSSAASAAVPKWHSAFLEAVVDQAATGGQQTASAVNQQLVTTYWTVGNEVLAPQFAGGWGARVIDRPSTDLQKLLSDRIGLASSKLGYIQVFPTSEAERANCAAPRCTTLRLATRSAMDVSAVTAAVWSKAPAVAVCARPLAQTVSFSVPIGDDGTRVREQAHGQGSHPSADKRDLYHSHGCADRDHDSADREIDRETRGCGCIDISTARVTRRVEINGMAHVDADLIGVESTQRRRPAGSGSGTSNDCREHVSPSRHNLEARDRHVLTGDTRGRCQGDKDRDSLDRGTTCPAAADPRRVQAVGR